MKKMKSTKNPNEPARIYNKDLFDVCPPGVDKNKWKNFRESYADAADLKVNDKPVQIDIELNTTCNLRCRFCINFIKPRAPKNIAFTDYKKIIDEASEIGVVSLKLNYQNEPLLFSNIIQYIEYAKFKGFFNIFFSTNGILLTPEISEKLINVGITKIFISLDAYTSEIYKKLRNSNDFLLIKKNIENFITIRNNLKLNFPLIRVNFLKNKENQHELNDFIAYWDGIADMLNIQDINPLPGNTVADLYIEKTEIFKCSMPFKQLVITANGDILPCCTMYGIEHKIGNIKNTTLKMAWNSKKIQYLRQLHANSSILQDKICKMCIYGK